MPNPNIIFHLSRRWFFETADEGRATCLGRSTTSQDQGTKPGGANRMDICTKEANIAEDRFNYHIIPSYIAVAVVVVVYRTYDNSRKKKQRRRGRRGSERKCPGGSSGLGNTHVYRIPLYSWQLHNYNEHLFIANPIYGMCGMYDMIWYDLIWYDDDDNLIGSDGSRLYVSFSRRLVITGAVAVLGDDY